MTSKRCSRTPYSNKTNIDVWLKEHCGDPIYVDRKSREAECIPHPALSAILTIQPSVLTEIMENTTMTGRGLTARFLYSSPPSRIGSHVFRAATIPEEAKEAYRRLVYRLMDIPVAEETQTLYLSEKAFEVIEAYFAEHEKYLLGEGQATARLRIQKYAESAREKCPDVPLNVHPHLWRVDCIMKLDT